MTIAKRFPNQKEIGDIDQQKDQRVHGYGERLKFRLRDPGCKEWDKGHREKVAEISPDQPRGRTGRVF